MSSGSLVRNGCVEVESKACRDSGSICSNVSAHTVVNPSGLPISIYRYDGLTTRLEAHGDSLRRHMVMARSDWILPRADLACGRAFYPSRQSAEGHRIALELWIQATRSSQVGYSLTTFRCKRCGGFHIGRKKVEERTLEPSVMLVT